MCELVNCLVWEVLVFCGFWNVWIDKFSYMGIAGILWLWNVLIDKLSYLGSAGICGYWNVWIDKLSYKHLALNCLSVQLKDTFDIRVKNITAFSLNVSSSYSFIFNFFLKLLHAHTCTYRGNRVLGAVWWFECERYDNSIVNWGLCFLWLEVQWECVWKLLPVQVLKPIMW